MNFEIILYASVIVGSLMVLFSIAYFLIAKKNIKKSITSVNELQENIKVGSKVIFAGGIFGKVKAIDGDNLDIEISKDITVTTSRYAVQGIC